MKNSIRYFLSLFAKVVYVLALLYIVLLNPKRLSHQIVSVPVVIPLQHTLQMVESPSPGAGWKYWWEFWLNLVGNIALFVPFGFWVPALLSVVKSYKTPVVVIIGLLTSFAIEFCQWKFRLGVFDVDDILLNATGTLIGTKFFYLRRKYLLLTYEKGKTAE